MTGLAIIGGSGFNRLKTLHITRSETVDTPYGEPSAPLSHGRLGDMEVIFLPRHGAEHTIAPHEVNYRANLWALNQAGARWVIAVAAVGGIRDDMAPGSLAVPDQIIDYTYGRDQTYFPGALGGVTHIDFTRPYCEELRGILLRAADDLTLTVARDGTYGATQGPRLETAREIDRLERDGCDMVGMTGMPEAALARELELCYACCAVIANRAAGRGEGEITMEIIERHLEAGMETVRELLAQVTRLL